MDDKAWALLKGFEDEHSGQTTSETESDAPKSCNASCATTGAAKSPLEQPVTFDTDAFLAGLDDIFEAHQAGTKAEPYLLQAMEDAEEAGDEAGLLTVLNETMGFYRSQGRHDDNQWVIQRALELGLKMGLEGTEAWTTTLINAATGMRAAKRYDQAEALYAQALESATKTFSPNDRRMAALHNNLSMLYSETGDLAKAQTELEQALSILETASVDPAADIDMASTHTNLALVLIERASKVADGDEAASAEHDTLLVQAVTHAQKSLEIYRNGHLEHSAHYASALAGYAQACFAVGRFGQAVENYRHCLAVITECYGTDNDYYRTTESNLKAAQEAAAQTGDFAEEPVSTGDSTGDGTNGATTGSGTDVHGGNAIGDSVSTASATIPASTLTQQSQTTCATSPDISGLKLARAYWEQYGKPLITDRYPEYQGRIAAGLVGHGSECYGFDDAFSHDHDFGPGFCLWLTDDDYEAIGSQLQSDYEALPSEFMGFGPRESTARAQGAGRRVGVFRIGDFFESLTGYRKAPEADKPHEWLLLDEATLAAATNGEVFADPFGAFSKTRQGFKTMPDDVRLALISRRLGMIAQAGQYNLPRSLKRGDGAAAWCAMSEFVENVCSLVFLINEPIRAGYMPYYKWRFAALRRLSGRMSTVLPGVCAQLEDILRLASAVCFGGAEFGEGGKGASQAQSHVRQAVEDICTSIVTELQREGLTSSNETFLEWQRPYIEAHIVSGDPVLHSL
jgi:tetratricopeptide (TPR) repeat protein